MFYLDCSEFLPNGTDFNCNRVWSSSLKKLSNTVEVMQLGGAWWTHWRYRLNCMPAGLPKRTEERDSWKEPSWDKSKSQTLTLGTVL